MHLHNHSVHSVIDGRGVIDDYLNIAATDGQKAFALTDHGTLGGAIEFYLSAKKHNVKPIIGMELYVDVNELREKPYPGHITVLAKNESGYRALIAANNMGHRQFYYRPRITLQQIIEHGFAKDWIILSGCQSSPLYDYPQSESESIVKSLAGSCSQFFMEVMLHETTDAQFQAKQDEYVSRSIDLANKTGMPLVLTNDCHYSHKHHERIHRELLASSREPENLEFDGTGFYLKTQAEMEVVARKLNLPYAIDNAVSVGDLCDIVIPEADKVNWYVPDITGGNPEEKLNQICMQALFDYEQRMPNGAEYFERYQYELGVIKTSPAILNSYLVAYDLVQWCNERGIPAVARGSMAGSLISHLLGITKEDPVKYNLSFARAVNPARPTIPDFDLDVSSARRSEILDYLRERYAGNIPIAAYTHYGPKGTLRKILRMEGLREFKDINEMAKTLPDDWPIEYKMVYDDELGHYTHNTHENEDGHSIIEVGGSDNKHHATNRYAPEWLKGIPEEYIDPLCTYEGVYSTMSVHPSGVLISGPERQLEHEIPLQWIASSKTLVSAYDMYTLKKMGLFKLDVLGLKTLDHLAQMKNITGVDAPDGVYDDPDVLYAFGNDRVEGLLAEIFQMDGYACRKVIESIQGIETFEDIVAANTLARPGCAQFTTYYRSGYEGLLREYPQLIDILGPTNGLILYQEQVMEISRVLVDFDDSEQDDVKESIKYFNHENWKKSIEPKFRERGEAKGIDVTHILEAIARMASYTFNRAHAMTYAAIAYKMMWYKVYHPAAFYASVYDDTDDKQRLILESHHSHVQWCPADINRSGMETTVIGNEILFGLTAIKGIGPAVYEAIAKVRPVESIEDFVARVEKRKCNKNVVAKLQESFAFANLGIPGRYTSFQECFGFNYRYLNDEVVEAISKFYGRDRVAGFITDVRILKINKAGPNHGKEMAQVSIMNSRGKQKCVLFPDVWSKAKGKLFTGEPIGFTGESQVTGDFIVAHGHKIDG